MRTYDSKCASVAVLDFSHDSNKPCIWTAKYRAADENALIKHSAATSIFSHSQGPFDLQKSTKKPVGIRPFALPPR